MISPIQIRNQTLPPIPNEQPLVEIHDESTEMGVRQGAESLDSDFFQYVESVESLDEPVLPEQK